jgi:hypothetical protein
MQTIGSEIADARSGAADCGEHRQAARAFAEAVN